MRRQVTGILIGRFGGLVWLTAIGHLSTSLYQAHVDKIGKTTARAADAFFGLGETLDLGERHETVMQAAEALEDHKFPS